LKPAVLRPQALRDQQGEVRHYRKEGGTRLAVKVAKATNEALDQVELEPGIGSPTLGKLLCIPGLRTWRVGKIPLLWCYFGSCPSAWCKSTARRELRCAVLSGLLPTAEWAQYR
jgi:toxin ParE1/3/4